MRKPVRRILWSVVILALLAGVLVHMAKGPLLRAVTIRMVEAATGFGVEVENMEEARARIEQAGAKYRPLGGMDTTQAIAQRQANMEVKFLGPDGVTVDLSEEGWVGTDE